MQSLLNQVMGTWGQVRQVGAWEQEAALWVGTGMGGMEGWPESSLERKQD